MLSACCVVDQDSADARHCALGVPHKAPRGLCMEGETCCRESILLSVTNLHCVRHRSMDGRASAAHPRATTYVLPCLQGNGRGRAAAACAHLRGHVPCRGGCTGCASRRQHCQRRQRGQHGPSHVPAGIVRPAAHPTTASSTMLARCMHSQGSSSPLLHMAIPHGL